MMLNAAAHVKRDRDELVPTPVTATLRRFKLFELGYSINAQGERQ
jgi:hypothetical protein